MERQGGREKKGRDIEVFPRQIQ